MKTFAFHSPKTAGNTIACLNLAIAYQYQNPESRVGLLTCARYPDTPQYLGLPAPKQSLHQLLSFIGTDEWQPALVHQLAQKQIIASLPSPQGSEWEDFDAQSWHKTFELISQAYDVLFIDLGRDIPHFIQSQVLNVTHKIITTSCLDPVGLSTLHQFLEHHQAYKSKQYLLINQAPKESQRLINKNLRNHQGLILGLLPFEQKHMWDQVYKGVPIVLQKKSAWKKALTQSLQTLQA